MDLYRTQDNTALKIKSMGEGKPIVFIHSIFSNSTVFDELAYRLSYRYQVIQIDLRGHGFSDKPMKIDFHDYADDIIQIMDSLYINQTTIIAHELGSFMAVELATKYPDRIKDLVLINPTDTHDILPQERLFRKYAEKIRTWDTTEQTKFLEKHLYYARRKVRKFMKSVSDSATLLTDYERQAVEHSFLNHHNSEYYAKVQAPTLIISGKYNERISSVDSQKVKDLMPNASMEIFNKSGVFPFVEEKDRFFKIVRKFIQNNS
ncbi:alpha/beta fold hydrolase [Staphylococcus massiliensis]|uniref:Alpha/beta hydrolase n=1 Tax=Staphylococcus massiliensis S46 TaxID=1229783 RepID=K9AWX8_9STAP|nr:alpha/beta hydrolase [Staphylococcus massiliensis]EKU46015.1 alpha/beta hydrolase [Staphylococcus massiliensis S46]MCG3400283.1 alpha/beta hydrolase [Staphylococcus massiliensis]MCG3401913.1 alpha/beta hydrolase [Staphylococcus massiliensis]MCG3412425.1 alpha/beta hydrolase [Staphylococcus massiliensis]PNZ98002.1 alpha/beta hydrolase [Staphylococcus massiliensis CCUG 55927]